MNLGYSIKILRKQLNITQQVLSKETGISQTSLSKIEGGTNPSEKNLKKIAKILGVPTSVIYILAMESTDVPEEKKEKYDLVFPIIKKLALQIVELEE